MPIGLPAERQRIAEILVAIGPERAAGMLRGLPEDSVHQIAADMATIDLEPGQAHEVLRDFTRSLLQRSATPGGHQLAKKVLSRLYGDERAREIAPTIDPRTVQPFAWLTTIDPADVADELDSEPPATVAVALAHLPPDDAAKILKKLSEELRADVALRVAALDTVAPDVVEAVDRGLKTRFASRLTEPRRSVEGVSILVDVLGRSSPKTQKAIVESIRGQDAKLAVKVQEQLFVFDDLILLDDAAVQAVLRSIETMDLAFALSDAPDAISDLIFRNLSERARDSLQEEMEYLQNPKAAEIKSAKSRIIAIVRDLEESGAIDIERPGMEEEEDDEDELDEGEEA